MAIKFKLSDEEKKKINKIATAMEEEKQTIRDTSSSQELPTASSKMKRKDDQKIYELPKAGFIANSRRTGEISNPFSDSRLINTLKKENETLKTAKEDLQSLGESSISSQTYEDMKSNDPKVSFPAKTRYLIDTAKGAITGWGKSIGQYLQTSVANDNQRVLDNKILAKFTDENGRKRLEETNKNLVEQIRKTQADKNADAIASQELSPTMQTLGNISRNLGNMAPTMALNALMPGTGNVAMFMSSSGDASGEELLKENNIQKAKLAGDLKGAIEVGAEKLTGGIKFLPKGTLDNTAVNFISKNIKSKVGQKIASKGYEVGGEVLEEVLTDIGQNTVDKFMYQDDGKVVDFDQLKETAKITVLTTLALNALGLGGSTYKEVQQQNKTNEVNSRINEAQKVINGDGYITQEQQTTNQANNNTNVERNLPTVNTENTYSNQLKQMASKEITNSNISEDYKSMMLDVLNNMNEVSDADVGSIRQNINSLESKNQTILNNQELPMQSYQYEKSDNAKINNLREDASKYFDNSKESHTYIDMLEKIIIDKDIDIRLDGNLKTLDGRVANGSYANGIITINPNSNRAGEFIAIHELTHAIGTKEMLNIVENYRKSNAEFDTSVKQLLGNYNSTEITEEALADVSAQLFGNQEFINNVANTNPSFFKKIYNEIKYLWHQFRGYKNQNEFVEDLYNKWTQAYNSNSELKNTENYHTSENFSSEIDKALNNQLQSNTQVKARDYTPQILVDNGVNNLPMLITQKHIKSTIYTLQEAENLGLPTKNVNYHGLGKDLLIKAIDNLDSPQAIYKTSENNYLVVTEFKDNNGKEIVIPIQINGNGRYNNVFIDENQIKSVYGRNNLDNYINKNNFEQIYKKNEELDFNERIQYSNVANSSIKDSIAPQTKDVNTTTKYSMQESENNSGSFSMQDKRFDVTGNENLNNASTLFFRTREDGVYYVQAVNNSGKITYDGSFIDKHSLEKTLGTDIAEYIVNNSESTNSEIYLESNKAENKTDYMMTHRPSEEYGNASNFERNMDGVFEHPEWYINMREDYNIESLNALKKVRKKPDAEIMIYRATPGNEINFGDWVTPSKKYAELHNNSQLDGKGNILELKVKAKDILWGGDDINEFGYFPENNRYSIQKESGSWQKYLEDNFKASGTRTNMQDILVQKASNANSYTKTQENKQAQTHKSNELETGEWTKQKKEGEKRRKHYESIIKSNYTTDEAKAIAKSLMGTDTYVPESNSKQLELADDRISTTGADSELSSLLSRATTGGTIKAEDIAIGERLIQYYSKTGNKSKLQDAIQATAMAGTTAGQTVQAMSLLNHQTPEGQAVWLQRSVDKMNKDLKRTRGEDAEQFKLTPEMLNKITNSENAKVLEQNLNEVYKELGQQLTKTTAQKIDAWRYFSMLANPRTHIRNIVGNTAMGGVQGIKNKVAGGIESAVSKINPDMERNHTVIPASKEVKAFAKADIENVVDRLGLNENKYNPKTRLENNMRTFKSDAMENTIGKAFDLNNKALEAEDGWGLKAGYVKALSEYMTANKLTPDTITDQQLGKARNFAIEQAKEATFHQDSQLASLINQLSNKNKFSKFVLDATLPFKKTPINVAKAGLEYSPVGLVKSAVYDTVQLRKGNITANKYIDNISKGLTGTGIALVGYALANCGVLKATGSDDEDKEKFEEGRGSQNYAITIGNNTYSLDWLAPSGIPLFIGAECYELMKTQKEKKTSSSDEDEYYNKVVDASMNILDSFSNAMNPMTEMSMLSGLTSALKSYDQGSSKMLAGIGTNSIKSYVNQFIPTALGQIAKTTDEYERNTTSTKTGVLPKAIDTTRTQIMNKIPGLRQKLPIRTDIWGQEQKQSDNIALRALENAVFPWARKELNSNNVDKEITKVYENTGESSVFPDTINKNLTIDKKKYVMTSKEFAKYKKQFGETSYELLKNLVNSDGYKKLSDSQKQLAIEKIYSYSTEQVKIDYARQNCLKNEQSTLSQVTNAIKKTGGNTSNYFEFLANTQGLDKDSEKLEVLANSKYDEKTKKAIYENSLGKKDTKYDIVKESFTGSGLNMSKYLQYKAQEFKADKKDDGTVNGKSITGSKKDKVFDYIDSIKGATYTQKLILYALEYKPSSSSDREIVENYVRNLPNKTVKEKLEIMSKFAGVTLNKPDKEFPDGSYDY